MRGRGGKRIKMKEGRGKTGVKDAERNIGVVEKREERGTRKEQREDHIKTTYQLWTDPFTVHG